MQPSTDIVEIPRGALWEDVIHGAWLAGLMGLMLFPTMGAMFHLAGQASLEGQLRGFVLSAMVMGATHLAWARIASLVLFDPAERVIHDAVRIGRTVYLQESLAFDQVESFVLSRRERARTRRDKPGCGEPEEIPLEVRGELHLSSGRVVPVSNWVEETRELPSSWSRLMGRLDSAAELLELPLEDRAAIEPPRWAARRYAAWIASIGVTAGFLVVFAA